MVPEFTEQEKRRQVEFADLIRAAGWKPAQAAREIKLSRASVSKILGGTQAPRPTTLEALRQRVAQVLGRGEGSEPRESTMELREQAEKLEEIRQANPEGYQAATVLIETLYRSTPKGKRAAGIKVRHAKDVAEEKRATDAIFEAERKKNSPPKGAS